MTCGKEMAPSPGPQEFKGKVDCLGFMWADVSLGGTEICLGTSKIRKEVNRKKG